MTERRVTLREITDANRSEVEAVVVPPHQQLYVASVADSLVEAAELPDAMPWYRGVYVEDEPVGFVMISDGITVDNPEYLGPYFLWRLLIDPAHQRRGIGGEVLDLVADHVRTRPDARVLLTSAVPGPDSPKAFYLAHGFRDTGVDHQGERVLERDLYPSPA